MRVIVTGAAGFLGQQVVARLTARHDVMATDLVPGPAAEAMVGDLADPETLASLFATPSDAVIHLATLPGGACEADPQRGWRINVEATQALADAAVRHGVRRFVYASSIAVFSDVAERDHVDDATPLRPAMLYGGHKALIEAWLATLKRRGDLDPIALRLPGLVARPGDGAGLKSAFLSDLFRAARDGTPIALPVSASATSWLMSVRCAAENIVHALERGGADEPDGAAVTLPALRVEMADLVAALTRHTARAMRVEYASDPAIEHAFGSYPPLSTPTADALGFAHDGDIDRLVTHALEDLG
ncbi:NAD-dependent epimerase/dehydratase family protein [Sphingomonas sp. MMS24-J45]|uniref:NAD-dependent epimerase/dehydratase family protein n=1 Tax=Sphingomonas sp. MMS24-J45 TaxID=3238806 RepID=UPI00384CD85B